MEDRKKDHIDLAFQAQTAGSLVDQRFVYEPVLSAHPSKSFDLFPFLHKTLKAPLWVSSMTGGTAKASVINHNLAKACNEFGLGMGLGSCRSILEDQTYFQDFNVRRIIGDQQPLFANLGICQIEQLFESGKYGLIKDLVDRLMVDGLIVHINPMQEWFQPEGDRMKYPPLVTLQRLLDYVSFPIIVKEVGQGMGYESLRALLAMPLAAIELGAFGGTNFSEIERMRGSQREAWLAPMGFTGADALTMVHDINKLVIENAPIRCQYIIVSGGIKNFLDGYYLTEKVKVPAIYGQASIFLKYALEGYEPLCRFIEAQIEGLAMAKAFLRVR